MAVDAVHHECEQRRSASWVKRVAILGVSAAAIATLVSSVTPSAAHYVWNISSSAPAGLYTIKHGRWGKGDLVAVLPATDLAGDLHRRGVLPNGKLLIKRVAAATGDVVCRRSEHISVNSVVVARARPLGSRGELLPDWQGCHTLQDDQVLLLGDTEASYDGRYFGVTNSSDIVGRATVSVALN